MTHRMKVIAAILFLAGILMIAIPAGIAQRQHDARVNATQYIYP